MPSIFRLTAYMQISQRCSMPQRFDFQSRWPFTTVPVNLSLQEPRSQHLLAGVCSRDACARQCGAIVKTQGTSDARVIFALLRSKMQFEHLLTSQIFDTFGMGLSLLKIRTVFWIASRKQVVQHSYQNWKGEQAPNWWRREARCGVYAALASSQMFSHWIVFVALNFNSCCLFTSDTVLN